MHEQEVYLVSSIGETFIGTVGDILCTIDAKTISQDIIFRDIMNYISDIVSEIAFGQNIDMSMPLTIELRDPVGL